MFQVLVADDHEAEEVSKGDGTDIVRHLRFFPRTVQINLDFEVLTLTTMHSTLHCYECT